MGITVEALEEYNARKAVVEFIDKFSSFEVLGQNFSGDIIKSIMELYACSSPSRSTLSADKAEAELVEWTIGELSEIPLENVVLPVRGTSKYILFKVCDRALFIEELWKNREMPCLEQVMVDLDTNYVIEIVKDTEDESAVAIKKLRL